MLLSQLFQDIVLLDEVITPWSHNVSLTLMWQKDMAGQVGEQSHSTNSLKVINIFIFQTNGSVFDNVAMVLFVSLGGLCMFLFMLTLSFLVTQLLHNAPLWPPVDREKDPLFESSEEEGLDNYYSYHIDNSNSLNGLLDENNSSIYFSGPIEDRESYDSQCNTLEENSNFNSLYKPLGVYNSYFSRYRPFDIRYDTNSRNIVT